MGIQENLRLINLYYPEYFIYIYLGKTRLDEYIDKYKSKYSNIIIIETCKDGGINTILRYKPLMLSGVENIIIRDADSEINERDRYCINDFLENKDNTLICQSIRDHFWHKSKIMAGLSFFKNISNILQTALNNIFDDIEKKFSPEGNNYIYGTDEIILNERIYPLIKEKVIVYTNICAFQGEKWKNIDFKNDGTNFCGNVIEYIPNQTAEACDTCTYVKKPQFNYFKFNIVEQLQWLSLQGQHDLMLKVITEYGFNNCQYDIQSQVLDYCFIAHFYNKNLQGCMDICKKFYKYEITSHFKNNTKHFYNLARELKYKIIGTCDTSYIPDGNKEIVIYYGNYPDDYMALPQSNRVYINTLYKDDICVDEFRCADCWKNIDKIFIMGLENEFERSNDTILQLALMNAPLNKIHLYKAIKDNELLNVYIGVTKNHVDCLKLMLDDNYETCLFLEDDFIFSSSIEENKKQLLSFLERKYDYDICFLSASKYHKREDFDDLLILSKQICTTSSGYLVNKRNIKKVYDIVNEGYQLLLRNKEYTHLYCIDRYWSKLQADNKVFIFKHKLGFQKPSRSKITGKINYELD
jgi:GR25 family glycosyltransferase involved in LPS biosynthesis